MINKIFRSTIAVIGFIFLIVVSLNGLDVQAKMNQEEMTDAQQKINKMGVQGVMIDADSLSVAKLTTDINNLPLQDNMALYAGDDPTSVVTMYLTVRRGNASENTNHTWVEINDTVKYIDDVNYQAVVPKAEAILQIGNENGPLPGELGFGEMVANATVQVRGASSSQSPQKSYKIELFNSAGEWRGQRTIALNKHVFDITRVRNKLGFDLMTGIPNMVSLRTQFVHLYVKDETTDPPSQYFADYGLYTQVELPNKRYLKNHLLDRYGQLYKTVMFEFYRYPEELRAADDPLYDEAAFSTVLEIKGSKDHTKLLQMLDDVNNSAIPIEQTFEKHFNADNYFTWMAFNILVGNADTNSQNFYLYSPQNGQKWYFLPWDYDGSFYRARADDAMVYSDWQQGLSNYWGVVLHRRVLTVKEYRDRLTEKIKELQETITAERVNNMLEAYREVVEPYVSRMPDMLYLPGTLQEFDKTYSLIPDQAYNNYLAYLDSLEKPMPFYLNTPELVDDVVRFSWGEAYDFDAEDITYKFELATDWEFKNIVATQTVNHINHVYIDMLEQGNYFWRVTATNESGKTQVPFDTYFDSEGLPHHGMKHLYVTPSGTLYEREQE